MAFIVTEIDDFIITESGGLFFVTEDDIPVGSGPNAYGVLLGSHGGEVDSNAHIGPGGVNITPRLG